MIDDDKLATELRRFAQRHSSAPDVSMVRERGRRTQRRRRVAEAVVGVVVVLAGFVGVLAMFDDDEPATTLDVVAPSTSVAAPSSTTPQQSTVVPAASTPVDASKVELRVPGPLVPGTSVAVGVVLPSGVGRRVELSLTSADGCAGMGVGAGVIAPSGVASIDIVVPAFLVRARCSDNPAVHRVLSDAVLITVRLERSATDLRSVRVETTAPVVGVAYRSGYEVVPPCGGLPKLLLGDTYWRATDLDAVAQRFAGRNEGIEGTVTLRSASRATFTTDDGAAFDLQPAAPGEVDVC